MRLSLLGPVQLTGCDGEVIEVGSVKRRIVLAALGLEAGRVVPVDRLLELAWDGTPPARARNALQGHISALRKLLAPDMRLITQAPGYLLAVQPGAVDVEVFRDHVIAAASDPQDATAADALQDALRLWCGPALCGPAQHTMVEPLAAALDEERRGALTALADRLLRCGRGHEAVPALRAAIAEAPLHEPLIAALVRCLHQAGRQADALGDYHAARHRLADDLGIGPGAALQGAYQFVLHSDQMSSAPHSAVAPDSTAGAPRRRGPVPAQLPRARSGFAGRRAELAWLRKRLADDRPVIICGPAGVGKTALVLHCAHQVASEFPDGQLFVSLHGFDSAEPTSPGTVLPGLLRALGVAAPDVPARPEDQAALYRTVTAERRMLVVLDDARSAAQARPLLPASADSRVVITSRTRLEGLITRDGATVLTLGPLTDTDALSLMGLALAPALADADPEIAFTLAKLCDNLPLALSIAAARLVTTPTLTTAGLVEQLRDERQRMHALATDDAVSADTADGDAGVSVKAALSLSYYALPSPAARLFTLSGLHPGADIDAYAAAALAGIPKADATRALITLASYHLAHQPAHGRFAFHDLVRLYARSRANALPSVDADNALGRLYDYYLESTKNAGTALWSTSELSHAALASPPPQTPALADEAAAFAWFETEEENIRALVRADSHHKQSWRLAYNSTGLYEAAGTTVDMIACMTAGLGAARHTHSAEGQARLLTKLGLCHSREGRHDEALYHLREAAELFGSEPNASDMYSLMSHLAMTEDIAGLSEAARHHHQRALDAARELGRLSYQARALNNLAWGYLEQSEPARALVYSQQAVSLIRPELEERLVCAAALHTHGRALADLGRPEEALACYLQSLDIAQELRSRFGIAAACHGIGTVLARLGQFDESRRNLNVALDLYTALDNTAAAAQVSAALKQR